MIKHVVLLSVKRSFMSKAAYVVQSTLAVLLLLDNQALGGGQQWSTIALSYPEARLLSCRTDDVTSCNVQPTSTSHHAGDTHTDMTVQLPALRTLPAR